MRWSCTTRRRRRGFTLMEMLIVLGILVMLIALAAPRFLGAQKKADLQTARTQIGLLRGALEKYNLDTKTFPSTEQGLQALLQPPASDSDESTTSGWDGPYLNKNEIPLDPWNHPYQYRYPPEATSIDFPEIWSFGPDGQDGTEDDICSWGTPGAEGELGEPGLSQPGTTPPGTQPGTPSSVPPSTPRAEDAF